MKSLNYVLAFLILCFIILTDMNAQTWVLQPGQQGFYYGISFTDANNGTATGTEILRTIDGGATWMIQTPPFFVNNLPCVSFIDANTGWTAGEMGVIFKTVDGGTNWTAQTSGVTVEFYGMSFTDANNGTVVGGAGTILRTMDGGTTWTSQYTLPVPDPNFYFNAVSFTDANNGTVVGDGGMILRTVDGGTTWTPQTSGTANGLRGVSFSDVNTGTVVGNGGTILRTIDGGTTWIAQTSGTTVNLTAVSYTDANNGTTVGENNGVILRTVDGGTTWTPQISGTTDNLNAVSFVDANVGYAAGFSGTILKTIDGGVTFIGEEGSSETLVDFSLSQNYPNPFNPSSTIQFQIPNSSFVNLKVYDVLGNEVATIINEAKPAGSHTVDFDASQLSSGIYYYQLKTGDFVQTKKMTLIK